MHKCLKRTSVTTSMAAVVLCFGIQPANLLAQSETKESSPVMEQVTMSGVGMMLGQDEAKTKFVVKGTADGSPASKTDIRPGDELIEIDGVGTSGMTIEDVVKKVRGPSGTTVALTFLRYGDKVTFRVVRGTYTVTVPQTPAK